MDERKEAAVRMHIMDRIESNGGEVEDISVVDQGRNRALVIVKLAREDRERQTTVALDDVGEARPSR